MPESYVEALYPYQAAEKNQISLQPHEKIQVLERDESGWWIGKNSQGQLGIFPSTYVKDVTLDKVFNKPKEIKPLPLAPALPESRAPSGPDMNARLMSREAKLASDLGFDLDAGSDSASEAVPQGEELQRLGEELEQAQARLAGAEAGRKAAAARLEELEEEAAECRRKEDLARTQLNVLKKGNVVLHETARRLQQEVQDLRAELEDGGRPVPGPVYECTPDEAIERFLASALGTLRQEHEELRAKWEAAQEVLHRAAASPVASAPSLPPSSPPTSPPGEGAISPEEVERLRSKYKRLEREYKLLRRENKELKAAGPPVANGNGAGGESGSGGSGGGADPAVVEKLEAEVRRLQEEYKLLRRENKELKAAGPPVANGNADPAVVEKLEAEVRRLQEEYKLLRRENKELKAAEPPPADPAVVEKLEAEVRRLQEELETSKSAAISASSTTKEFEDFKAKVQKLDKKRKAEIQQLAGQVQQLQDELLAMTQANEELLQAKSDLINQQGTAAEELKELRASNHKLKLKAESAAKDKQAELEEVTKRYRREEKLRRQYFNELQEMKGNIRVFCRCKPASEQEAEANGGLAISTEDNVAVKVTDETTGKVHTFEFDIAYGPSAAQQDIFRDVQPLATSVLDGYNACIFAYGQTGSGKTYTMEGPPTDRGVNFRTMNELFGLIESRQGEFQTEMSISVIEVYNEQIYDLLNRRSKLDVRFTEKGGVQVPDIKLWPCTGIEDVVQALTRGYECRKTAGTNMNEHSSRSHCLLSIYIASTNLLTNVQTQGKLHLVDLAGSERLGRTGASDKERVDEAKNINSSLTQLGIVINSLANKRDHIPYRNSALTKLLQDSLGGNCKCLMFANISMLGCNCQETLSTLKFAAGARQVELGKAEANKVKKKKATGDDPRSPVS